MVALRSKAMETKDFSAVDELKAALADAGVDVRVSKSGVDLVPSERFDSAKLWKIERNRETEV
jgi:cysteinyl-tRNA synthetase